MPVYHEAFRVHENVCIADETALRAFQQQWAYHHPLQEAQFAYAGRHCFVRRVSFYHGGDRLYELGRWVRDDPGPQQTPYPSSHEEALPGYWHENCLNEAYRHGEEWEARLPLAREVYAVNAEVRQGQPVVVVKTHTGLECLVARQLQNEREAASMNEVASRRNALAFERRYAFEGVMEDASRAHYSRLYSKPSTEPS